MESATRMATTTENGGARAAAAGFELRAAEEEMLHSVLRTRREAQRVEFRPGVVVGSRDRAADVVQQERSKKKLARAFRALRELYGVEEDMACEALTYTNSLEDALRFLALQHTSSELPLALRALPSRDPLSEQRGQPTDGTLEAEINDSPVPIAASGSKAEGSDGEDATTDDVGESAFPTVVDGWDDDDHQTDVAETPPAADTAQIEESKNALSWTQQYVQLMAQREQEEAAAAAAVTTEEKEILQLEEQYAQLQEAMQHAKQRKNNSKKRQKMLAQEIQAVRQRLIALGWDEARYHQKQGEGGSAAASTTFKGKKSKKKTKKSDGDEETASVPSGEGAHPVEKATPKASEEANDQNDAEDAAGADFGGMFEEENDRAVDAPKDTNTGGGDDDGDGDGGLFGLLEEAESTIVSADAINKSAAVDDEHIPAVPVSTKSGKSKKGKGKNPLKVAAAAAASAASSTAWTGKSPRDHLQEFCMKRRLPRPVYKKKTFGGGKTNGKHVYSVVIDWKTHKQEIAVDDRENEAAGCRVDATWFTSIDEAKDTVATVAMYRLTPDLPLYRVLPPSYRDLWVSWVDQKEKEAAAEADAEKNEFDTVIDGIFSAIPAEIAAKEFVPPETDDGGRSTSRRVNGAAEGSTGIDASETLDNWDVDDWDADLPDHDNSGEGGINTAGDASAAGGGNPFPSSVMTDSSAPSPISLELKRQFEQRMQSPAYQKLAKRRADLPMAAFKAQLLDAIESHDVILVSGETGCGKSTQVPQFLLEDVLLRQERGESCQIVCTQPRRLAATSLAARVSQELGEREPGAGDSLTGYQIRLENRMTRNTKLLFCTTGILLRKLQDRNTLEHKISHIIVDEVHERDLQNDVLLSMLRQFLATKPPTSRLKVILMSATLNADSFQRYFGGEAKCPMLSVPGRTFPVKEFFLEDVLEATKFVIDEMSPAYYRGDDSVQESTSVTISGRGGNSYTQKVTWESQSLAASSNSARERQRRQDQMLDGYSEQTRRSLDCIDPSVVNYELITELVEHLVTTQPDLLAIQGKDVTAGSGGRSAHAKRTKHGSASILVFLPGLQEITTLLDLLSCTRTFRDGSASTFHLIPLHSSLSPQEQQRVFDMPDGAVRVIAATNIAETSLTIEDVKIVIDAGRVKQMRHDSARRTNVLDEIWISRANAKQRMGRAGRTSDGVCYRLFPRSVYTFDMDEQPVAEIRRAPLASLCLQIKSFGIDTSCREFLGACLDPPPDQSVRDALEELFEIGALRREDETLTTLGGHLAKLPVDVKVGKMLLLGAIFGEFDVIATCAAILETRSPFVAPFGRQADMKQARKQFAVGNSDMLSDVNAFQTWQARFDAEGDSRRRSGGRSTNAEKQFCHETFLNRRALVEIDKLKRQFRGLVGQLGFLPQGSSRSSAQDDVKTMTRERLAVVAALLFAGLAPNLVLVEQQSKRLVLREQDRGIVVIHPGSINHKIAAFPSPFLTYAVKLHTSQVYLPQSSLVMPAPLCLFSHNLELLPPLQQSPQSGGGSFLRVNDWIVVQSSLRSAVLLQETRAFVQDWIDASLQHPPFAGGAKKSSPSSSPPTVDSAVMVGAVARLLAAEYDQRDPNQFLTRQLHTSVQARG